VEPGSPNFCVPCSETEIFDNIGVVVGDGAPLVIGSSTTTDRDPVLDDLYGPLNNSYHHNLWFNQENASAIVCWGNFGERHVLLDLEGFRARWEGYGEGSVVADPLFVNATALDLRLRPDSPARGAASDGTDMGVDFSELPRW